MSRKLIICLAFFGLLIVQAQADLDLTGGRAFAAADANNTTFGDGTSPWSTTTGGANNGLWWERPTYGYDAAGVNRGGSTFEVISDESFWRATGDVQQVKTTVSGLTTGQLYAVFVVYGTKHAGENWNVTADFHSIVENATTGTVESGVTYGADANSDLAGTGVNCLKGQLIEEITGGIYARMGLVGFRAADASGEISVYVDDLSNDMVGGNNRTWYNGIYVVPEPMTIALLGLGGLFLRRRK